MVEQGGFNIQEAALERIQGYLMSSKRSKQAHDDLGYALELAMNYRRVVEDRGWNDSELLIQVERGRGIVLAQLFECQ